MTLLFPMAPVSPAEFDEGFRAPGRMLAGTDEAGRGPLAGPVVAAAVILPPGAELPGVTDSKKMTAKARERAYGLIDRLAVAKLRPAPGFLLVDGDARPPVAVPLATVVKGDAKSLCVGAASVMAKVTRDRLMMGLHALYPQYGFDRHKGYGTAAHLAALAQYGPSPCHRLTFRGVRPAAAPTESGLYAR